jgi:hypothetical protein
VKPLQLTNLIASAIGHTAINPVVVISDRVLIEIERPVSLGAPIAYVQQLQIRIGETDRCLHRRGVTWLETSKKPKA